MISQEQTQGVDESVVPRLIHQNAAFRRLFLAHSISRAGDAFNTVALVVLVFQLTGSGLGVAGTVACEVLPILLLGPVAGLIVDRYPRRTLMVAADVARAGLVLLLVAVGESVAVVYGVALGLSSPNGEPVFCRTYSASPRSAAPGWVRACSSVLRGRIG